MAKAYKTNKIILIFNHYRSGKTLKILYALPHLLQMIKETKATSLFYTCNPKILKK